MPAQDDFVRDEHAPHETVDRDGDPDDGEEDRQLNEDRDRRGPEDAPEVAEDDSVGRKAAQPPPGVEIPHDERDCNGPEQHGNPVERKTKCQVDGKRLESHASPVLRNPSTRTIEASAR